MPTAQEIITAHQTIAGTVHRTPVFTSHILNEKLGCELYFKCENFQKTGSFKPRGAYFSVTQLPKSRSYGRQKGVATHSSGNHGQALAWVAAQLKIPAYVVMPENSPQVKVEAVRQYGGEICFCSADLASRQKELEKVQQKTGAAFIPPYNYKPTIAGQATCAKELLEDYPDLDNLLAPVGGGGLLAGTALSARYFAPKKLPVYGCEPRGADDAYRSFTNGTHVKEHTPNTIADGLRTTLGDLTFPLIRDEVTGILLCSEAEITEAMRLIWQHLKIVVEPSGAVPLACLLSRSEIFQGQKLGLIVSGGNVDLGRLPFTDK